MHHTDNDHNLRKAKHRAAKKLVTNATSGNSTEKNHTNLLPAFVTDLLMFAILILDGSNAASAMDVAVNAYQL